MVDLPKKVSVVEVGLRDGIQNECTRFTLEQKIALLDAVVGSGIRILEIGSFVRPDKVPQMAETGMLFQTVCQRGEGLELRALIPNFKGLENAVKSGCRSVKIGVSASRTHNLRNYNRTPEESIAGFASIFETAAENGVDVMGTIQMAFGSPWEGEIPQEQIFSIVDIYRSFGLKNVGLGDTASLAEPRGVYRLCSELCSRFPEMDFKMHFHNARGLGLSNVLASLAAGITEFDSSFAGLGGCPFVPGAAGNISTEDLVNLLQELGIETGIDLDRSLEIGHTVLEMVGHEGNSYLLKAGTAQALAERLRKEL